MNAEKYRTSFGVLSAAGAGVILTRTREPHRVLQALQMFAHEKTKSFRYWNFRDGWVHYNVGYQRARYRKKGNEVFIEGLIRTGTVGTIAFTLPVGFRPAATLRFCSVRSAGIGIIDIDSSGNLTITAGSSSWTSIHCSFLSD